jgi:hypothetical protein
MRVSEMSTYELLEVVAFLNSDVVRKLVESGKVACPFCGPKSRKKRKRFVAESVQHFWQVVDNQEHIWVAELDSRYGDAETIAKGIALLLNVRFPWKAEEAKRT